MYLGREEGLSRHLVTWVSVVNIAGQWNYDSFGRRRPIVDLRTDGDESLLLGNDHQHYSLEERLCYLR